MTMAIDQALAAWQPAPGRPLEIGPVTVPQPGPGEILVHNRAVAINPVDWILQDSAIFPWLDYPAILGSDVAGEVAAVGEGVQRFQVGDRVLGQSVGATTNQAAHGAFQDFTIVLENMASPIPPDLSFRDAAVLPLGVGTAACGLFEKDHLALHAPRVPSQRNGQTVLIWGASSSVGCNAIQLATAAGYACIVTASPHNRALVEALGASQVFDRNDSSVVEAVTAALRGTDFAGALHATGNMAQCFAVVSQSEGRRFVSTTLTAPEAHPANVETKQIFATTLKDNEVSQAVYVDFLPAALAARTYRPAPPARVVGHGLQALQQAFEIQKQGVSGEKIVVDLE